MDVKAGKKSQGQTKKSGPPLWTRKESSGRDLLCRAIALEEKNEESDDSVFDSHDELQLEPLESLESRKLEASRLISAGKGVRPTCRKMKISRSSFQTCVGPFFAFYVFFLFKASVFYRRRSVRAKIGFAKDFSKAKAKMGRPLAAPLFSDTEKTTMKEELRKGDVHVLSKTMDLFKAYILQKLQYRAGLNGRNPDAVTLPNRRVLLALRNELLPDKEAKYSRKNKRRLEVLGDFMSQISLIGAMGAVLYDGDLSDLARPLVLPALLLNSDSSSYAIRLGQRGSAVYMAEGARAALDACRRIPGAAAALENADGPSQDRTLHLNITAQADGDISKLMAIIKDNNFTQFAHRNVSELFARARALCCLPLCLCAYACVGWGAGRG